MTDTHQIQFNNYLVEFIQKLKVIFPSSKRLFSKYYKYYRNFVDGNHRVEFIAEFVQYISKYNVEMSSCDEGLFSEEDGYYPNKPIQLMKGIDFKLLWHDETLTEGSKEGIWKYLQTLYLIGTFVLKETDRYNELLKKQQEIIYNLLQNMKYERKIKEDAEKLNETEDKEKQGSFDLSGMGELFDENNIIIQIATEIAKEINFSGELGDDPIRAISQVFDKDSGKLEEIITKISKKLTSVLKEKGLSEQDLLEQAKAMNTKILGKLKGIPGMPDIEQLTQKIFGNLAQDTGTKTGAEAAGSSAPAATAADPHQLSEEQLKQCQNVIKDLTNNLKENFSQMGVTDLDSFADNVKSLLGEQDKDKDKDKKTTKKK
jgi:hypothetical protein